jgi:AcrR family transcriptional regulator
MDKSTGRRGRKKEATRRAIAEAAMRLFLERSFDRVTVAEVAETADVSVNTVFNHFPTKEDLFFAAHPASESWLAKLGEARKPHEPVIEFMRRYVGLLIEQVVKTPVTLADIGFMAAVRRSFLESSALQIHATQSADRASHDLEEAFTLALAKDVKAEPDDLTPRLVAAQIIAICATLFLEAERRRRLGEKPEKIQAVLSAGTKAALNLLENGIGNYGRKPR